MFPSHSPSLLAPLREPAYRTMTSATANSPSLPSQTPSQPPADPQHSPFLSLPLELREQIYALYFRPADRLVKSSTLEAQGFYGGVYGFDMRVLRVCKQVGREARRVWRREVRTVKVGTPWVSAGMFDCSGLFESVLGREGQRKRKG